MHFPLCIMMDSLWNIRVHSVVIIQGLFMILIHWISDKLCVCVCVCVCVCMCGVRACVCVCRCIGDRPVPEHGEVCLLWKAWWNSLRATFPQERDQLPAVAAAVGVVFSPFACFARPCIVWFHFVNQSSFWHPVELSQQNLIQKGSNECLFILTWTQYVNFWENPLYQATKWHLNNR